MYFTLVDSTAGLMEDETLLQKKKNVQPKLQASDNHTHLITEFKIHFRLLY
jgi:hypothetical protein